MADDTGKPICSASKPGILSEGDAFQILHEGDPKRDPPEQGDILFSCPYVYPYIDIKGDVKPYSEPWDAIILGHSCDIQNLKVDLVLLCPIWEIINYYVSCIQRLDDDAKYREKIRNILKERKTPKELNPKEFKNYVTEIFQNACTDKLLGYAMLPSAPASTKHPNGSEPLLVDFTNAYSLPLDFIKEFSKKDKNVRLRLTADYRIDLVSRFNYFLVRASVPTKELNYKDHIAPIIKKSESEIDNKLNSVRFWHSYPSSGVIL